MLKKRWIAGLTVLALAGCTSVKDSTFAEYHSLSQEEAYAAMTDGSDPLVLDVRTAEEYAEGHIAGAVNLPNESISDTEPEELQDKNRMILVYCRSGRRSKDASEKLVKMGYTNVWDFGGLLTWPYEITKD